MKTANKKEKMIVSLSLDRKLNEHMEDLFDNKSKYIEWLIYQDLIKNGKDLNKIII